MYEFDAIGTHWWCEILGSDGSFPDALKRIIQDECEKFDKAYSRFRDDSLVMKLYQTGELLHPPKELIDMLAFAKEMYEVTDGAFDITVGNTLHHLGYGKRKFGNELPEDFWNTLSYSPESVTIPPGIMLDFGGFGKGWLIDRIAEIMRAHGIAEYIVNGGGDLYVESDTIREIALEDPHQPGIRYGSTSISRGALAASSTQLRRWEHEGVRYHHIIDPRTKLPTHSVTGSFVKADRAILADAIATALIVNPSLESHIKQHYSLDVIIAK